MVTNWAAVSRYLTSPCLFQCSKKKNNNFSEKQHYSSVGTFKIKLYEIWNMEEAKNEIVIYRLSAALGGVALTFNLIFDLLL